MIAAHIKKEPVETAYRRVGTAYKTVCERWVLPGFSPGFLVNKGEDAPKYSELCKQCKAAVEKIKEGEG